MTRAGAERDPSLSDAVRAEARRIGFDLVGITPSVTPIGFHRLRRWIQRGFAGEMSYLPQRESRYESPQGVLDGTRSVIMLAVNYRPAEPADVGSSYGRVSRYAWGSGDYHDHLRNRLRKLADMLHREKPGCRTRGVVDTAPLLERDFAVLAGLGWFGKNTMLIHRRMGSWLFLAALLTDLELEYDQPHSSSHCGTCTRCLDACPTGAFPEPWVLDARKCISYLNIELRDRPIPREHRGEIGDWLFGCDVCQEVCPWNRKAPVSALIEFQPQPDLTPADCVQLLRMDEQRFHARFGQTPLSRPGRRGILRNAAIVLGNTGTQAAVPTLRRALADTEPLVRGASAWALGEIGGRSAIEALRARLETEPDKTVRAEIHDALRTKSRA